VARLCLPVKVSALAAVAIVLLAPAAASSGRTLHIGLVVGPGTSDSADTQLRQAFFRSVKRLGVDGRVVVLPPSLVATAALTELVHERLDLIITGPSVDPTTVAAVAARHPSQRFLLTLPSVSMGRRVRNVQGIVTRTEEGAFLAGYLAARMDERRVGKKVVSSVGGYKLGVVDEFIAGYQAGARLADPTITTLNAYAQSFNDPAKCHSVALGQITRGSGVVFGVAGACSAGALAAAKHQGVWGIGVDVDRSYLGRFVLTSVVDSYDAPVLDAIRSLKAGTFTTGSDSVYDLRNGGVALGRFSPLVPLSLRRRVAAIGARIVAGRITVPTVMG
jgi:basic membrane protein A